MTRSSQPHPAPKRVRHVDACADVSDATLVERAMAGERWAEEALYRRHAQRMHDVANRLLARYADAEDAVQDAFVTAFTRLDRLRDPAQFEAWLYRIVLNEARSRLRRWKLLRRFGLDRGEDDGGLAQTASPEASPAVIAELVQIDRVLRDADPDARIVWIMNRVEGWSLGEIAEVLEISLPTAKRRGWQIDALLEQHLRALRATSTKARLEEVAP